MNRFVKMWLLFSCSVVSDSLQPVTAAHQASLSFTVSQSLLKLRSIESVMPSNNLMLYHPLLLSSIFPSIRVFSNESALHIRSPKYENFSFSISLPMDIQRWFSLGLTRIDHLAVQGTLKSLFQHHSLKASILQCSAIFMVQLSPICVLKKPKALTRRTFVGKVMSLVFSMLSRFIIVFLPRSKHLLISFMAAVIVCSDFGDQ